MPWRSRPKSPDVFSHEFIVVPYYVDACEREVVSTCSREHMLMRVARSVRGFYCTFVHMACIQLAPSAVGIGRVI